MLKKIDIVLILLDIVLIILYMIDTIKNYPDGSYVSYAFCCVGWIVITILNFCTYRIKRKREQEECKKREEEINKIIQN